MAADNQIKKQIKFAVVMYGGGSLAIYINGVAQELLKLAQATNDKTAKFDGTTLIYRKIALLLSGNRAGFDEIEKLQKKIAADGADAIADDEPTAEENAAEKTAEKNGGEEKKKETNGEKLNRKLKDEKTNVEFIIDVLTGSSAGGINAVFLSKALVNGAKNMDDLQALWLEQGDFTKLLNDRQSVVDNSLNAPQKPESLLNSQRMYLELLKAMDKLDGPLNSNKDEACVRQDDLLDLYVTYTDFEGLPTNLVLADKTVLERVHKRVFNFRHAPDKDDFKDANNPFLAFAARCTSSFPLAFEPMRLTEIREIIDIGLPERDNVDEKFQGCLKYFSDLTDEKGKAVDWTTRWFVDGGCLDNKPFGYAIDKLAQRTGEGIVERKLLYVEPNPESFRDRKKRESNSSEKEDSGHKPNALENVFGQASGLPSYETIREDLQRVLDRNRLIERVARLTAEVEKDFSNNPEWFTGKVDPDINWSTANLDDVAMLKGAAFVPYYRLRVSSTTDEIARLVTRFFKIDDNSDYFNAVRCLIRNWRELNYHEQGNDGKETFNGFLYQFDVEYRLRRLRFMLQKAEYMLRCASRITDEIRGFQASAGKWKKLDKQCREATAKILDTKHGALTLDAALFAALPGETDKEKRKVAAEFKSENYVKAIYEMQSNLSRIYAYLRRETEFLKENLTNPPVNGTEKTSGQTPLLETKGIEKKLEAVEKQLEGLEQKKRDNQPASIAALESILIYMNRLKREDCNDAAALNDAGILEKVYKGKKLEKLNLALKEAADELNQKIFNKENAFLRRASSEAKLLLGIEEPSAADDKKPAKIDAPAKPVFDDSTPEAKFVRAYLRNYYELFDSYDQISFPLYFESPVGEAVKVDVVRISSRDAHSLINEEKEDEKRRKLAGDYLFAFGAFLDPRWRLNDIMWGRLDGAERLITTLLRDDEFDDVRDGLIDEANKIILGELLMAKARDGFQGTLVEALTLASTNATHQQAVDKLVANLTTPVVQLDLTNALTTAMGAAFDETQICTHVKDFYEVNRRLEPQPTLKMISRSTQIIGKILEDITQEQVRMGDRLSWISKLGQVFWGLVTVAAPNSIWNLLFNYWIQLLYLFEVIVVVGATLFVKPELQQFGVIALIITLGIHLTVIALEEVMLGNNFWKTLVRFLIGSVLAVFVVTGALFFYSVFFDKEVWDGIDTFRQLIGKPEFARWHKLVPVAPFAMIFVVLALWREAEKLNLKLIGRAIMLGFVAVAALGWYFNALTGAVGKYAPIIELEFIGKVGNLANFVADLKVNEIAGFGKAIETMKTALWLDSFAFIPLYWGFLLVLSSLLNRRRQKWASAAAIVAALSASAGALADFIENYYSLKALAEPSIPNIAAHITLAAEVKWTLVFISLGILSAIFLRSKWSNLWNLAGALLLVGAIAGIVGTFKYPFPIFGGIELLNAALIAEFVILLVAGIAFQFKSLIKHFLRGY